MTRAHFTAFSYLQLLLTPPQLFGFTPHLSSSSPLTSSHLQTVSFSARSLPIEPENAHFSIRHRSRESCARKPPRSTPRSNLAALQGFLSVQWGRGHDSAWTTAFLFRCTPVQYPDFTGQKGRASLIQREGHVQQTTCDCGRYRSI
ncbi:hypothetical protein NA56DRAFT_21520 [Hyaloscypha hepaticicola]|uniref:Secreted protein n=1 Tax=Hyaloscypha hepaticicola TaxID=2082293 RepID=A0A2J6QR17_9HELO|nr:hypothetical protein NA56DRAFT_21520 [Hyaloscypha hepaticicola]